MRMVRFEKERAAHDRVVDTVADFLTESGWTMEIEPRHGSVVPDLLGRAPDGSLYVFEIKTGAGQGHLGAVAQAESMSRRLGDKIGATVRGVVVLATDAPVELDDVARRAGVTLIRAEEADPVALRASVAAAVGTGT